jgi:hypothetical protein
MELGVRKRIVLLLRIVVKFSFILSLEMWGFGYMDWIGLAQDRDM